MCPALFPSKIIRCWLPCNLCIVTHRSCCFVQVVDSWYKRAPTSQLCCWSCSPFMSNDIRRCWHLLLILLKVSCVALTHPSCSSLHLMHSSLGFVAQNSLRGQYPKEEYSKVVYKSVPLSSALDFLFSRHSWVATSYCGSSRPYPLCCLL